MAASRGTTIAKALAWPAAGAAVGISIGVMASRPATAPFYLSLVSVVGFSVGLFGLVFWTTTRRKARARAPARAAAKIVAAPTPAPPRLSLNLDGIAERYPDVWGVGDPLAVRVVVTRGEQPLAGQHVKFTAADSLLAEAVTDATGTARATVAFDRAEEATLEARADDARAERTLRIVRYHEEIPLLGHELRAWVTAHVAGGHEGMTMREVADTLATRAPAAARAAAEAALVFETVEYGSRKADRGLYERLIAAMRALEEAGALA